MHKIFSANRSFETFKDAILNYNEQDTHIPDSFCLGESHDGKLREYDIPFDYVNTRAKIIIVGLTPGRTQWENAVLTAQKSMLEGDDEETVLRKAKQTGAFSGGMRGTLIEMLDYISLNKELGIDSVARCFEENSQDIHFTSVFTQPIFKIKDNKLINYSVSAAPNLSGRGNDILTNSVTEGILREIRLLPQALIFTLGAPCAGIFDQLIRMDLVEKERVFNGLPHPLGANRERIAYFLNKKDPLSASAKTDPYKIYQARDLLIEKIKSL